MTDKKIKVEAYSGYKGEELPRSLIINDKIIVVTITLKMWIEEGINDKNRKRYFEIEGSDGFKYKLYFDENLKEWFLHRKEYEST
ncbi:MAG: hypothetical protein ACUVUQ_08125 [Thermodesulfovibrionales bacterium]